MINFNKDIFKKVLAKVSPSEDFLQDEIDSFVRDLNQKLKNANIDATAKIGGSFAKRTFLKNDFDVDVFVRFNYNKYKESDVSRLLGGVIENYEEIQGSRIYYKIRQNNITFELVPVLNIKDPKKAKNVMDMSPLHVNWVRQKLIKNPGLADDIRLAKLFCKAHRVYGAESYIRGFSGHVLDILVLNYGSFENMVKQVSKWNDFEYIDIEKYYKDIKDAKKRLNKEKMVSPLIIIDPILPDRNAAAALSEENFEKFKLSCLKFLEKPSVASFVYKPINYEKMKNKISTDFVLLDFLSLNRREDIAGSKIVKFYEQMLFSIRSYGFKVKDSGWEWDKKKKGFIFFSAKDISKDYIYKGPYVKQKYHADNFKRKHKDCYEKNNRLYIKMKREHTQLTDYVKYLLKDKQLIYNLKSVKLVK